MPPSVAGMLTTMRVQVSSRKSVGDGRADALIRRFAASGRPVVDAFVSEVFIVDGVPSLTDALARELFCDPVAQTVRIDDDAAPAEEKDAAPDADWSFVVEVTYRPGVTDPVATSIHDALVSEFGSLPPDAIVQTGRQYFLRVDPAPGGGTPTPAAIAAHLYNPLIEHATVITRAEWESGVRPRSRYATVVATEVPHVDRIDVAAMSDAQLEALSRDRLLALSLAELAAVREYYANPSVRTERDSTGIGATATDVELEMIAQTWSEHCKHKIFAAKVRYRESEPAAARRTGDVQEIDGLFGSYIKATTDAVGDERFVKSVFHDNAGVIRFDDETLICIKAETHNSPSALDPYGGAITGIVGVNRDIMGTGKGARPIFNTDVLCFGHHDTPPGLLPAGLLHPRVVMEGVHRGIVDGGNQSGIPVAAGAFLFDESYTGKPLVFCGTGGVLPATIDGEPSWIKHTEPGDLAVMVGGRIGKDGIHGATFSSLALDETSPTSAVQIGEPITQKKMAEFLLEARDRLLYKGITDNGAGGLSSSFGEMARDSGGVRIDLDGCPLKYHGLAAWEILVSESQERMSLAVSPSTWPALAALAVRHGVEVSVVGEFTDSGAVIVTHQGAIVADLSLDFLHDGVPQLVLDAHWPGPGRGAPLSAGFERAVDTAAAASPRAALLALIADPNIGSKEQLVRQYDHEVQAGSVVKPFCGRDANGPTDGGVIRPRLDSTQGLTVTHGICPRYGDRDTYEMAVAAVDEAVRAHVVLGGDPARMAALDNFCWPDPVVSESTPDGAYKMAQLVRACRGLADACRAYRLPLVSGKDSMKNDARLGGVKVSIRPTLLVTLTGIVPDVRHALTSAFSAPGDRIYLLGGDNPVLDGSAYERICGRPAGRGDASDPADRADRADAPTVIGCDGKAAEELDANARLYAALHRAICDGLVQSAHDLSDGGFAVAVAECAIGGKLGANVSLPAGDGPAPTALFGERFGRILVTVRPDDTTEFARLMDGVPAADIGAVTADPRVVIASPDPIEWSINELTDAWNAFGRSIGFDGAPRTVRNARRAKDAQRSVNVTVRTEPATPPSGARPRVVMLTGLGINADRELAAAFEIAGATVDRVHVNELISDPSRIDAAGIVALPGGFSYGDHVGSGMMLAHRLRTLRSHLDRFRQSGRLILGICNGFQVLVKMGILPDLDARWEREATLVHNASGRFEDSWVTIARDPSCRSAWLDGIDVLDVPIRHGEGRFVVRDDEVLARIERERLVAFRYSGRNPNGSSGSIAGIVDRSGTVLGMMPHPEAFLIEQNHPLWRHRHIDPECGLRLFANAVAAVR